MSYNNEPAEHVPCIPPLALHCFPVDFSGPYHHFCFPFHGRRFPPAGLHYYPCRGCCEYSFEPAFIRKRNERERHRVRCVNEGYVRLRQHLPQELEDRRLSKVETLRAAIDYIKHLQRLLEMDVNRMQISQEGL
ncbi:achaete-scute homolog 3 [Entelurus aequoreus]|uniref:achaete-scute homolog 3 n=1 Tax=Entelurus aequoreus TaxID=161455 RepID=UPI002B1E2194|nr:achaete-scute homolog 3 [Entelurus aequoreus]